MQRRPARQPSETEISMLDRRKVQDPESIQHSVFKCQRCLHGRAVVLASHRSRSRDRACMHRGVEGPSGVTATSRGDMKHRGTCWLRANLRPGIACDDDVLVDPAGLRPVGFSRICPTGIFICPSALVKTTRPVRKQSVVCSCSPRMVCSHAPALNFAWSQPCMRAVAVRFRGPRTPM